jgi:hypothetical protein
MRTSRRRAVTVVTLAPGLFLLAGCGSSSSTAATPAVPAASVCTQIGGVLSDGPDPHADPVGYAEAQIAPLAALHPTAPSLRSAVASLDAAFRHEYAVGATRTAKAAVRAAQHRVNVLCPGAAS